MADTAPATSLRFEIGASIEPLQKALGDVTTSFATMAQAVLQRIQQLGERTVAAVTATKNRLAPIVNALSEAGKGNADPLVEAGKSGVKAFEDMIEAMLIRLSGKFGILGKAIGLLIPQLLKLTDKGVGLVAIETRKTIIDSGMWEGLTVAVVQTAGAVERVQLAFKKASEESAKLGGDKVDQFQSGALAALMQYPKELEKMANGVASFFDNVSARTNKQLSEASGVWGTFWALTIGSQKAIQQELINTGKELDKIMETATEGQKKAKQLMDNLKGAVAKTLNGIAGVIDPVEENNKAEELGKIWQNLIGTLKERGEQAEKNARLSGLSADVIARGTASLHLYNEAAKHNITVTDQMRANAEALLDKYRDGVREQERARTLLTLDRGFEDRMAAIQSEVDGLGKTRGQIYAITELRKLEISLRRAGNILSEEEVDRQRMAVQATAVRMDQIDKMKAQMQSLAQVGQTVGNSLERAFDNWLSGSWKGWRDFFQNLLKDLALLQIRASIIKPLFGGGEGDKVGLFGKLLEGIGFKAAGGPVAANSPYIVGENGPELFVPNTAGNITPNGAFGGAGGSVINFSIDARGAEVGVEQRIAAILTAIKPEWMREAVAQVAKTQRDRPSMLR